MNVLAPTLGQLLGVDASTWAAIASAVAGTGAWATAWQGRCDVRRTLNHAEGERRRRNYDAAMGQVLLVLSRALVDIEQAVDDRSHAEAMMLTVRALRPVQAELEGARFVLESHASDQDDFPERLRRCAVHFKDAVDQLEDFGRRRQSGETRAKLETAATAFREEAVHALSVAASRGDKAVG